MSFGFQVDKTVKSPGIAIPGLPSESVEQLYFSIHTFIRWEGDQRPAILPFPAILGSLFAKYALQVRLTGL